MVWDEGKFSVLVLLCCAVLCCGGLRCGEGVVHACGWLWDGGGGEIGGGRVVAVEMLA